MHATHTRVAYSPILFPRFNAVRGTSLNGGGRGRLSRHVESAWKATVSAAMYLWSRKSEVRPANVDGSDSGRPDWIQYRHTDSPTPPLEEYAKTPTFRNKSIRTEEGAGSMTLIAATMRLDRLVAAAGG